MLRCAITDGTASSFVNSAQIEALQNRVRRWAADGIDFIQLREKQLDSGALFALADAALRTLRDMNSSTKLMINARADVAIAVRARGVHLTSRPDELAPEQVRELFIHAGLPAPVVGISCHTADDILRARGSRPDYVLFGPVVEKRIDGELIAAGVGVDVLRHVCTLAHDIPVLALGGVTTANTAAILAAGAAGVAGIRLFAR
ncbi:MAG TPA: thiamine phosphate synthase [Acidobacteriaceae bacterium]|nr:thiamine phosphate synthase [Acidobacteriaceae bacterium]